MPERVAESAPVPAWEQSQPLERELALEQELATEQVLVQAQSLAQERELQQKLVAESELGLVRALLSESLPALELGRELKPGLA